MDLKELQSYTWNKHKNSNTINKPIEECNYLLDILRYAVIYKITKL